MKKNEFLFMIFGLDSEYCTILDTNFIIKINRIILCNPFKKKILRLRSYDQRAIVREACIRGYLSFI